MRDKETRRLMHEKVSSGFTTEGAYTPERFLMHGSSKSHSKSEHSGRSRGSSSAYVSHHKDGGMVRARHNDGGSVREEHGIGGSILGHLANFLPFKEGGKVSASHLKHLSHNRELMKMIKSRHKELSGMKGNMGHKEMREHHFLGSLIRGALKYAKPLASAAIKKYGPSVGKMAMNAASPYVQKGINAVTNRLPSSVRAVGAAAAPMVKSGLKAGANALEQSSPKFAKGMGMARSGARAFGFEPNFKKGGKVRARHATGAIAKERLGMY